MTGRLRACAAILLCARGGAEHRARSGHAARRASATPRPCACCRASRCSAAGAADRSARSPCSTMIRLAGWREPESEEEFEALVRRAEALAADGRRDARAARGRGVEPSDRTRTSARSCARPSTSCRSSSTARSSTSRSSSPTSGWRYGAYGLYQGDTVARDHFHDRILIFRDTLERDFGHDPELLAPQVRRTVRHELGHHLGWDERGVRATRLVSPSGPPTPASPPTRSCPECPKP